MTPEEEIEKAAIKYVIEATGYQVLPEHEHWKQAFIAGANLKEKELASLKEANAKLRNKTINEAIAAILSSEHTKSLAIMRAVNDIIKKVEALKSS